MACALVASYAASAPSAPAGTDPEVRRLRPGVLLYASPDLREPNFSQTVVLLVEYGPQGAMGLVINRPTEWKASEALKDAGKLRRLVVYWGGPVQPDAVFGLVRAARPPKGGVRVLDGVFLTGRRKDLDTAVQDDEAGARVRVYSGYAGWGAGQLEGEVLRNGWIVASGDADAVFSRRPEEVWDRVHHLLDRLEARTLPVRGMWHHSDSGGGPSMASMVIERPGTDEYAPAFAGYVSRVPEVDIDAALARQAEELPSVLAAVRGEGERHRYAAGKWSVRELVGHVIDTERIMGYRAVCVARGETVSLPGFDENAYAEKATFDDYPLAELLEEFVLVRQGHLHFFRHLSPEAWLRKGIANQNPISVRALAWVMVGHVRHHMAVLEQHYLPRLRA